MLGYFFQEYCRLGTVKSEHTSKFTFVTYMYHYCYIENIFQFSVHYIEELANKYILNTSYSILIANIKTYVLNNYVANSNVKYYFLK